jgi:PAS domain S-box-containing protein
MEGTFGSIFNKRAAGYIAAAGGIGAITAIGAPFHDYLNDTTVALALLLMVLFVSSVWGRGSGIVASVLGMLCFNFFFLPPLYTFTIADPRNWIALAAFVITASVTGHLSIIAKRRAAEAEAGRKEASFASAYNRSLIEASLDPLVTIGCDGKITDVNAATESATGHSRVALIGTDFSDYFTEPEKARAGYQRVFREGFVRDFDLELRHRDGRVAPVLYNASIYRDGSGEVVGVFAAARDITQRKQAEEALRESEANLNRAQEVAHIGSWYLNVSHDGLTWSDEVFRIFGIGKGTALTYEAFLAAVHPEDRDAVDKAWTAALQGAPYDIEHRIIVGSELKWVRERAKVEFGQDGKAVKGIGTVQDITERKLAEEEIRRLNADLEQRVIARTVELRAANKLKDELLLREQAASAELAQAREREIEIGYRIQRVLLLDQPPKDIPGLRMAALTIPSQRIDGDFYFFFEHPDRRLDVVVGDVMGKGVPAALLSAATKSHFIEALSHLMTLSKDGRLPEPKDIVMLAHAEVARHLIDLENFVTLCYARLDLDKWNVDLVDCGHTGLVHVQGKTGICKVMHGDNLPLGVREGEIYSQISVRFDPGDLFVFYSDGITEARNAAGELFGLERLTECIRINRDLEPETLVEAIRQAAFAFSGGDRLTDDLTCVALKAVDTQSPLAHAELDIGSDLKELGRARQFVSAFCRDLPYALLDEESVAKLELAITELCSNIIKHAYHDRADQGIHLEAEAFPSSVSIRLHHLGDPFEPSLVSPPALDGSQVSGFGMFLIAQSVDDVRYYRDEHGRNCIALVKFRKS